MPPFASTSFSSGMSSAEMSINMSHASSGPRAPQPITMRNPTVGGPRPNLYLVEVQRLAGEDYWQETQISEKPQRGSFIKHETATDTWVRVNVHCKENAVGIVLDHPRQGKTQVFINNVTMGMMKEIFDDPRAAAGYRDPSKKPDEPEIFNVEDRVEVKGNGRRCGPGRSSFGCVDFLANHDGNLRVFFEDSGEAVRFPPTQLRKIHKAPQRSKAPTGKAQSLKNECKLQQRRLRRELEHIIAQLQLVEDLSNLSRTNVSVTCAPEGNASANVATPADRIQRGIPSPTSVAGSAGRHHFSPVGAATTQATTMDFGGINLDAVLSGSGAFNPAPQRLQHPPPGMGMANTTAAMAGMSMSAMASTPPGSNGGHQSAPSAINDNGRGVYIRPVMPVRPISILPPLEGM